MKTSPFACLLSAALALTAAPTLAATDLYVQALDAARPLDPVSGLGNASAVFNAAADPGFNWTLDTDQELWVYFTAPSDGSFNQLNWYGSQADGLFALDLFSAGCVSCAALQVPGNGRWATNLLTTSGPFAAASVQGAAVSPGVYQYALDLATPVSLVAGQLYGLSIVNNYSAAPFQWARATGGGSGVVFNVGLAQFLKTPGNLAFALTDTTAPPVPEPGRGALLALGLGFTGLLLRARQRQAQR